MTRRLAPAVMAAILGAAIAAAPAEAGRTVTIFGRGWGHGIGMSQYGAYGRALQGWTASGILRHYYRGVTVRRARVAPWVRVGLLQGRRAIHVTSEARAAGEGRVVFKVYGARTPLVKGVAGDVWRIEPSPTGGVRLYKNGVLVKRGGRTVFGSPARPLVLDSLGFTLVRVREKSLGYAYGKMQFAGHAPAACGLPYCLRLVLRLPMQRYIYGLGEVPASWPPASLRAQAIAARTYAHRRILSSGQHREPCDCALYDSALDQVYLGDAKRTGSGEFWDDWKRAVDTSARVVVVHRGLPIQALYSSSSGGHTENNENVWGGKPVPYLRGVRDRADRVAANPNHRWQVHMSWARFASKLNLAFGVGKLRSFRVVRPFGVSGRVTVVKSRARGGARVAGSRGVVRADGWAVRDALDLKDTWFRVRVAFGVARAMRPEYDALDGAPGNARSLAYAVPLGRGPELGRAQRFEQGRMTWVNALGRAVWQRGPVLERYDALGRERSALGMPTSSVRVRVGYLSASYSRGLITWSPDTGARAVVGEWADAYRRAGGPLGPLGLPTSEVAPGDTPIQRFTGGALYRVAGTAPRATGVRGVGARVVVLWGPIYKRFQGAGGLAGACGAPVSSVASHRGSAAATFERGTMTWSAARGVEVECAAR